MLLPYIGLGNTTQLICGTQGILGDVVVPLVQGITMRYHLKGVIRWVIGYQMPMLLEPDQ